MEHPCVSGEGLLDEVPNVMTNRQDMLKLLENKDLDLEQGHAGYAQVDDSIGAILKKLSELGIGTRGAQNPGFFDYDQLYDLRNDPKEQKNLAADTRYRERLKTMRGMLKRYLESFDRPFGEFVSGGNASPPGLFDEQVKLVKKIKIEGKKIILPDGSVLDEQSPSDQRRKAADRENHRANRRQRNRGR